jgi:hypothetical protein
MTDEGWVTRDVRADEEIPEAVCQDSTEAGWGDEEGHE